MVGKKGRSGRTMEGGPKRAFQLRLEEDEAEAFDRLIQDRNAAAKALGGTASGASILRATVRKLLVEEGYLKDSAETRKGST